MHRIDAADMTGSHCRAGRRRLAAKHISLSSIYTFILCGPVTFHMAHRSSIASACHVGKYLNLGIVFGPQMVIIKGKKS